jgi:cytochrome c-type biogenesis protein CcmH/NrfG
VRVTHPTRKFTDHNEKTMADNSTKKSGDDTVNPPKPGGLLLPCLACLVIGFIAGIAFTVYKSDPPEQPAAAAPAQQAAGQESMRQAILNLEATVTAKPDDHQAWTRLGHLYYDDNQPEKAIAAYSRSLELHPGDANILTDLGVMYRRTDRPERAIELFDQAIALEPDHLPSRFNKGIVLYYDLDDPAGAIASWQELQRIAPEATTPTGETIAVFLAKIKEEATKDR